MLQKIDALDTVFQPNGIIGVPAQLNGTNVLLGLDTGSTGTSISATEMNALGL